MSVSSVSYQPGSSQVQPDAGGAIIVAGEFAQTNEIVELMFDGTRIVDGTSAPRAMGQAYRSLEVVKADQLPALPHFKDGMEPIRMPITGADPQNRLGGLEEAESSVRFTSDTIVQDIHEIIEPLTPFESPGGGDSPQAHEKAKRAVKILVGRQPSLTAVVQDFAPISEVLNSPFNEIFTAAKALSKTATKTELLQKVASRRAEVGSQVSAKAGSITEGLQRHVTAINSLRAMDQLAGGNHRPTYLINTRDLNELLAIGKDKFVNTLSGLGLQYADIVFANPIRGKTKPVFDIASQLETVVRNTLWVTIGGIFSQDQAIAFSQANPAQATTAAGAVALYLGGSTFDGYSVADGACVFGNQLKLDASVEGPLAANAGPQATKHLAAVEPGIAATFSKAALMTLAKDSGINCVVQQSSGNISPYTARAASALKDYRFGFANRVTSLVEGAVMAYFAQNVPQSANVPMALRCWADLAKDLYLKRFEGHQCYVNGSIEPIQSGNQLTAKFAITLRVADIIEEIIVTRGFAVP